MFRIVTFIFLFFASSLIKAQIPIFYSDIKKYIVYKTPYTLCIDGKIDEEIWQKVLWTDNFMDIEGKLKPEPKYATRVKMLWDDDYLYFAAYLEEPHIWASLTERESVIFYDNDFEIFIDPDGDTHNYMEFEINALATEWDLFLAKPYRDWGSAVNSWNLEGIKSGVHICGTLNNPTDKDTCWTVEIAIPWNSMIKYSATQNKPVNNEQWRINFSRVEWDFELINGIYIRKRDENGNVLPEHNWVWSSQGVIAMHQPETWGFVQFSDYPAGTHKQCFIEKPEDRIKLILREVYYSQKRYFSKHGRYANTVSEVCNELCLTDSEKQQILIYEDKNGYKASYRENDHIVWYIRNDGKVYKEDK